MEQKREVLLSIRDLEIKFNDFIAVSDINFDIYKGETFSLVGESGSEKVRLVERLLDLIKHRKVRFYIKAKRLMRKCLVT